MAVSIPATFVTGAAPVREALVCAGVFAASGLGSAHGWAAFGAAVRRFLASGARLTAFNATMGLLVAASGVYLAVAG
jgi:threonine/homoserine/homoserine lactone efflux protein